MRTHPEYWDQSSSDWILMASLIREFKKSIGTRMLVVCPLPYYVQIEGYEAFDVYLARFQSLDNGVDLRVVNIFPYFELLTEGQKRKCRWKEDIHFTPFAHEVVAGGLYQELKKLTVVPKQFFKL
jgi:hypothetical protein